MLTKRRTLLIGRGYIGTEFAKQLRALEIPYYQIGTGLRTLGEIFRTFQPDYVINAAGYTGKHNVDDCEQERHRTMISNVVMPMEVCRLCRLLGIPWLHVSSGCLFHGPNESGYREDDVPNITMDQQIYAGSKLITEQMISGSMCYICRIRMPFADEPNPRNLITKLINYNQAMAGTNSLSYLPEAVKAMIDLLYDCKDYGIYHVTQPGGITTVEMIDMIEKFIKPKRPWPIVSQEHLSNPSIIAPRSVCVLSTQKIKKAGIKMTPVKDAFEKACRAYRKLLRK